MKTLLAWLALIPLTIAVVFGLGYLGLNYKRLFAPRLAEIDRQVFENTPSFVHGKAQYIARLRLQYETAEEGPARTSLRTLILHEASTVDPSLLPIDTQQFLRSL